MVGDQSYTWDQILPYFKKSISFTPPNYEKRGPDSHVEYDPAAFSSHGGPLQVSYSNYYSPTSRFVKGAFEKIGLTQLAGAQSGKLIGFADYPLTLDPRTETRSSSETSFLLEAIAKTPLQVYQSTLVKKILFENKKASGVLVNKAGASYTLSARNEVILAAGPVSQTIQGLKEFL